jgi:hypothetical protein
MFDSMGAFEKQFTSTEGGYIYYPSRKTGGKLITTSEYEELVKDWGRVTGRWGRWKLIGGIVVAIILWSIFSAIFDLPETFTTIVMIGCVVSVSSWLLWASYAPRRLVKDRPAVTPPRDISEARQQARAMLNWPFVAFALAISGAILFASVQSHESTIASWAWLVGSGLMFVAYIWIAIQKLRDR